MLVSQRIHKDDKMKIKIIEQEINGRKIQVQIRLPDNVSNPIDIGTKPDYTNKSKARLIDLAKSKGIKVAKGASKKEVIALLNGAS
tara:strand:+ start:3531 stop:3788 length:258 start_codon:yes stop_codon:yes gene_type:complete